MKKLKLKKRRQLNISDFRSHLPKLKPNILLCDNGDFIDVNKIEEAFPNKMDKESYIDALIRGME